MYHVTVDMIALRNAALKAIGIIELPAFIIVMEQLKDGSLIHLLPKRQPKSDIIHPVYPSRRGLLPAVMALVDFLTNYYQSHQEA